MKKLFTAVILALLAAAVVFASGSKESAAEGSTVAQEVTIGQTILPNTLDPHMETGGPSNLTVDWLFYDNLIELGSDGSLQPGLAESWEVSDDKLHFTFHLRDDVTFHDGTKLDADAVKWNFDRLLDPNNKLSAAYQLGSVESVDKIDSYTVRVNLKEQDAVAIYVLAARPAGMIVSPAAVEKWGKDFSLHPTGTGPFVFQEWVSMDRIVATRNPDYWRRDASGDSLPYLDKVTVRVVPDTNVKLAELRRGTLQIIDVFSAKDVADAEANPDVRVVKPGSTYFRHLTMNTTKEPLSDKRVRQAICYAIDSEAILKATAFGEGYLTAFMANKRWPGYDPNFTAYQYDPEKAKQLLAEAGYDGKEIKLKYSYYNVDPERAIGELIQAQLKQVGINVSLDFIEVSAWIQLMRSGKSDLGISRHETPMPHPWMPLSDRLYPWEGGGRNWSLYENPRVTVLLNELKKAIETEEQGRIIKEMERIVVEDAPYYSIYQQTISRGARTELEGFKVTYQGAFKLYQAKMAE